MNAIVFNNNSKMYGLPPYYYRYVGFNNNLNGNTPAEQYQKKKLFKIQFVFKVLSIHQFRIIN